MKKAAAASVTKVREKRNEADLRRVPGVPDAGRHGSVFKYRNLVDAVIWTRARPRSSQTFGTAEFDDRQGFVRPPRDGADAEDRCALGAGRELTLLGGADAESRSAGTTHSSISKKPTTACG
jgi:hypothetical protein